MTEAPTLRPTANDPRQLDPLAVGAREAARLSGVSLRTWWRAVSAGVAPKPYKLLGKTLWRFADLKQWTDAGFPRREDG